MQLELSEDVAIPAGTRVRINIDELQAEDDYAARLEDYYRTSSADALEEERALAERLSTSDASLPDEEPWW